MPLQRTRRPRIPSGGLLRSLGPPRNARPLGVTSDSRALTRTVHEYSGIIWTQRPHEPCGLRLGHEALHLASAPETGARRRTGLFDRTSHLPVRWTRLPRAWGCLA